MESKNEDAMSSLSSPKKRSTGSGVNRRRPNNPAWWTSSKEHRTRHEGEEEEIKHEVSICAREEQRVNAITRPQRTHKSVKSTERVLISSFSPTKKQHSSFNRETERARENNNNKKATPLGCARIDTKLVPCDRVPLKGKAR
tara:strand:- start:2699 stop:3124 length:426 start_codon:yes stop_codon:yes gene_type:complete